MHGTETRSETVETLLAQLPYELRERWEQAADACDSEEAACALLKDVVTARKKAQCAQPERTPTARTLSNLDSERLRTLQQEAIDIVEMIVSDDSKRIGEGQTSRVFYSARYTDCCFKCVHDPQEYAKWQPIDVEAELLSNLATVSYEGIRTPVPYFHLTHGATVVLCMERMPGVTIRDICEKRAPVPAHFDVTSFQRRLLTYVRLLHDRHRTYHRDLHEGNIMLGDDGSIYVIDFNKSIKVSLASEDPYNDIDTTTGNVTAHYTEDEEYVRQVVAALQRALQNAPLLVPSTPTH